MRQSLLGVALICLAGSALAQQANESPSPDAQAAAEVTQSIHEQLRQLRDRLYAAYENGDMDLLLQDVAPNVVITWQNADRNEGHEEFLKFYDEMMNGDDRVVKDLSSTVEVDDLSVLYGDDAAVARGTLADHFVLTDGSEFTLNSKWTATVVKLGDRWKVASFHVSANIFDNPILAYTQGWLVKVGLVAGLIGLVVGLIIGRVTKRV
jgi:ketosteroid isomerase-like protein